MAYGDAIGNKAPKSCRGSGGRFLKESGHYLWWQRKLYVLDVVSGFFWLDFGPKVFSWSSNDRHYFGELINIWKDELKNKKREDLRSSPGNSGRPETSSARMHPTDQTSTEQGFERDECLVPRYLFVCNASSWAWFRELCTILLPRSQSFRYLEHVRDQSPKSEKYSGWKEDSDEWATLTSHLSLTAMLDGFKSRWIIPAECIYWEKKYIYR